MNAPIGKGIFLWQINKLNIDRLIADLQSFDWVAVKIIDSQRPFYPNYVQEFLEKCQKDIWAWGYTYAVNPEKEAFATAKILNTFDKIKGYFIDAEHEYKTSPATKPIAKRYIKSLRSYTDKPLGLCSYRFPDYHREFPFKDFLEYCDFHAPQVYWIGDDRVNGPEIQTKNSIKQLQKLKNIPVCPVGVACKHPYKSGVWQPKYGQLDNFINYCKLNNLSYSFWEYKTARENPDWWNSILCKT